MRTKYTYKVKESGREENFRMEKENFQLDKYTKCNYSFTMQMEKMNGSMEMVNESDWMEHFSMEKEIFRDCPVKGPVENMYESMEKDTEYVENVYESMEKYTKSRENVYGFVEKNTRYVEKDTKLVEKMYKSADPCIKSTGKTTFPMALKQKSIY